jgi:hypothetical protein
MSHKRSHAAGADVPALQLATPEAAPMRKSTNGTTVACAVLPDCDAVRNWTNMKASSSRVFGDLSVMGPL